MQSMNFHYNKLPLAFHLDKQESLKIICANLVEIGTAVLKCIAFTDRQAVRRRKKILDQNQALNRFQFVQTKDHNFSEDRGYQNDAAIKYY